MLPQNSRGSDSCLKDLSQNPHKVETPIHDNVRELVTWECKEHRVKS
jgi:hypothetical protein